jgi:hypothetical protein
MSVTRCNARRPKRGGVGLASDGAQRSRSCSGQAYSSSLLCKPRQFFWDELNSKSPISAAVARCADRDAAAMRSTRTQALVRRLGPLYARIARAAECDRLAAAIIPDCYGRPAAIATDEPAHLRHGAWCAMSPWTSSGACRTSWAGGPTGESSAAAGHPLNIGPGGDRATGHGLKGDSISPAACCPPCSSASSQGPQGISYSLCINHVYAAAKRSQQAGAGPHQPLVEAGPSMQASALFGHTSSSLPPLA